MPLNVPLRGINDSGGRKGFPRKAGVSQNLKERSDEMGGGITRDHVQGTQAACLRINEG